MCPYTSPLLRPPRHGVRSSVRLVNSSRLDASCTHLVAGAVVKTEKVLSAVAKGDTWILHR